MKVVHIITGLNNGGAEGVLYRLCKHDIENQHLVISMMDEGKYGSLLKKEGIEVCCLNMPQGRVTFFGLWKLFRLLRKNTPDVVQTWMYHADLIGGVIAKVAGIKNVFWNVRHTTLEPGKSKRSTIYVAKACAILSNFIPKKIIYCAYEAKNVHETIGYKKGKSEVIGNGYDLNSFRVDSKERALTRETLGISENKVLLGMVGRYDPQKDHKNLIEAISSVAKNNAPFKLFLIGRDLDLYNVVLIEKIESYDLSVYIALLGQRTDIPSIMNSLDLHILSSSFGEAFPNVLAEAMACGTPCVTTDVGDAAVIVGDTGWVVEPKNPQQLAHAIESAMLEKQNHPEQWDKRKQDSRERIVNNFSIEKMIENYNKVWKYNA